MKGFTLEEQYATDPALLALYRKKLPQAGWAGATDDAERDYIKRARKALGRRARGRHPSSRESLAPSRRRRRLRGIMAAGHGPPPYTCVNLMPS